MFSWFFMDQKFESQEVPIGEKKLEVVRGDITTKKVDVVVNAANSFLKHGGGVAFAIVKKGGKIIQEESDKIGFVPVGKAVITGSGKLPCKAVIHTVGPKWGEGMEDEKLKSAIKSALKLASENDFRSISIPAISAGIYGFPKKECASILIKTSKEFLSENKESSLNLIQFCIYDPETLQFFKKEISNLSKA